MLNFDLLSYLLANQGGGNKAKMLKMMRQLKECLAILKRKDILSAFFGKRSTIPITDFNEKILDTLVKKHWIVSYDVDKKDENIYWICSKRILKQQVLPTELL